LQNSGYGCGSALLGPLFEGYGRRWGRCSVTMPVSDETLTARVSVMGPQMGPQRFERTSHGAQMAGQR